MPPQRREKQHLAGLEDHFDLARQLALFGIDAAEISQPREERMGIELVTRRPEPEALRAGDLEDEIVRDVAVQRRDGSGGADPEARAAPARAFAIDRRLQLGEELGQKMIERGG